MTHRPGRIVPLACAVLLAASGAQAVTLSSVTDNGNVASTAFSTSTLIAVDVGFNSLAPVEVIFALEAADVGASVAFNSILSELTGRGLPGLRL